jgi:3-oxoadipate enol-lactonase
MPRLSVGNAELEYRLDGPAEAPVLMLSNSLGTSLAMWEPQMPALTGHFRVLRYDARGHGRSSVPPGDYAIAQMGEDALALLRHVGARRAHFCGLSMGGMVGMWLGINAPAVIDRLALCNTAARIGPPDNWNARIARVREGGMSAIVEAVLARWFTPAFIDSGAPAVQEARAMLLATSPQGYCGSCAAVRDMDQRDDIGRIIAPTLVVAGTRDVVCTPADHRFLAERIDGARYVELDAPHISNLEQPAAYTRALVDFLTE